MKYLLDWINNYLVSRRDYKRETKQCITCLALQEQLVTERTRNEKLLEHIIQLTSPKIPEPIPVVSEQKPIYPARTPWVVRQRILEAEDRKRAELEKKINEELKNRDIKTENDELEKELNDIAEKHDAEIAKANA